MAKPLVVITGSNGFLGKHVLKLLKKDYNVVPLSFREHYLKSELVYQVGFTTKIDYFIHLAAYQGNIQFNLKYPLTIFQKNNQITSAILDLITNLHRPPKQIIGVIPSCAYPDHDVLMEENFFKDLPNETISCHGLARRNWVLGTQFLASQYETKCTNLVFNNLFGPGDSTDLNKTKVCGGLIVKFLTAIKENKPEVVIWGSGQPKRELLYVKDAAQAILCAMQKNEFCYPVINIGHGQDISILDLASKIQELTGYTGKLVFDRTKPDGQMRKLLSNTLMKNSNFYNLTFTEFDLALKETIDWYKHKLGY